VGLARAYEAMIRSFPTPTPIVFPPFCFHAPLFLLFILHLPTSYSPPILLLSFPPHLPFLLPQSWMNFGERKIPFDGKVPIAFYLVWPVQRRYFQTRQFPFTWIPLFWHRLCFTPDNQGHVAAPPFFRNREFLVLARGLGPPPRFFYIALLDPRP